MTFSKHALSNRTSAWMDWSLRTLSWRCLNILSAAVALTTPSSLQPRQRMRRRWLPAIVARLWFTSFMDFEPLSSADVRQIGGHTRMTTKSRILKTTAIEREIGEIARAAKLQLRFDKVVRRLTGDLKAMLASVLPEGQSVVITVTAPIKYPAKTAETLENIVRDGLAHGELCRLHTGAQTGRRTKAGPAS